MKKLKIYASGFLFAILAIYSSCKKDKGNYEYHPINEVNISKIDSIYNLGIGEKINISPTLNFTTDTQADPATYSYQWYYYQDGKTITISTSKDINVLLPFGPGLNYLYYKVTDKSTTVSWIKKIQVKVEATISKGWLFLCDIDGKARLDMAIPETTPTATNWASVVFKPVINDVLAFSGSSLVLKGKPLNVNSKLYISTDALTTTVAENTFAWTEANLIKYSLDGASKYPGDYGVEIASEAFGTQMFYKAGKIYVGGSWVNHLDGEAQEFYAAPYIEGYTSLFTGLILFDNNQKRFFNFVSSLPTNTFRAMTNPTSNAKFNYNIGMDMVYMQATFRRTGSQAGSVYSLLKDATSGKYYIAGIGVVTFPATYTQEYYGFVTDSNISRAEHFTFSSNYPVLFYNIGSLLYEYNYLSNSTRIVADYGAEKIVLLKNHRFSQSTYAVNRYDNLMVATYNPALSSQTNGTVYQYLTPEISGADLKLIQTYKGTGKVVSLTYHSSDTFL